MNIVLSPELENLVNEKIKSGWYDSPSEVVRDGLILLQEEDELKKLRREKLRCEVMKGINEMREGKYTTYNSGEELAEEIIRRGKKKLAEKQQGK